ncbi:hypothetical protein FAZ19_21750 [Sphingobacterium alkalisoli]|uniref:Uncharacterized protein n=1 Tax=Sphingobacterium alkalisoli TaxID=1874115 RepID=A0A4U0GRJ7_9SPHI|nr:hypothetical protein [Sphingobacterium alkalisoli]TJY61523.1 hypothetical protein FAZ19_21750 [Sphingobacterium alkalisoli]GGH29859.1 hypothetical protein GCM10011418_41480 [Sphingobacterium alkalisoli]
MMTTLLPLENAIDQHLRNDGSAAAPTLETFTTLCQQVLVDMSVVYKQYMSKAVLDQSTNQAHLILTHLSDKLSDTPAASNHMRVLQTLINQFEQYYGQHIKAENPIAHYQSQQLQALVAKRLPDITTQLKRKAVPIPYLDELVYAMASLFQPGKLPELQHYHRSYITRLLDALEHMANDQRDKPWPERFISLLVNIDFNYMGFYNRWADLQNAQLDIALTQGNVAAILMQMDIKLAWYRTKTQLAYDPYNRSLLHYMQEYLRFKKKEIKLSTESQASSAYAFIPLQLNGNQAKLFFHACYAVGLYDASSKEEAAKFVAQHIRTDFGTVLSPHSLRKYDKDKLAPHADFVIRKLKAMTKYLEDDFR